MNPELNIFAFIEGLYATALGNAMTQNIQAGLQASRGWLHVAGALWVLSTAVMALLNNLGMARLIQRTLRVLIVSQLIINPDLYTRFVVQPVMTGFPNQFAQSFGGPTAKTMPGQFASVYNEVTGIASGLRTQASGPFYIPDRIAIWIAEMGCKYVLVPQFALFAALQLFTALAVIAGTLVLIFYFFDATKRFAEAWIGIIVGCLVTFALMSITMQMILQMNVTYMQHLNNLPAAAAGNGLNVPAGAEILVNIGVMFFVGFFWMICGFVIGFGIGCASGMSASAILKRFASPV